MDYLLENLSPIDLSYLWSPHPMFRVEEGTRIEVPEECNPAANRHRYRLKGVDSDWYEAVSERHGRSVGLAGGD